MPKASGDALVALARQHQVQNIRKHLVALFRKSRIPGLSPRWGPGGNPSRMTNKQRNSRNQELGLAILRRIDSTRIEAFSSSNHAPVPKIVAYALIES